MRWASGEVRRGHTSYDSLRRIQINPDQSYLSRRGDLLRRVADFQAYGSCRPPLGLWDLRFWDFRFEISGLKVWEVRFKILDLSFVRLESWELRCRGLSFEKAKISLHDRCPVPPPECDLCSFWNLILLICAWPSVLYLLFCCFQAYRTAVLCSFFCAKANYRTAVPERVLPKNTANLEVFPEGMQ